LFETNVNLNVNPESKEKGGFGRVNNDRKNECFPPDLHNSLPMIISNESRSERRIARILMRVFDTFMIP